jgi:predicted amidohydrolase YtcJ
LDFLVVFDDSVLKKTIPTREDLDQVTTEFPIMIVHISGHFASLNSKGLEMLELPPKVKILKVVFVGCS